jgi:hypothetical protein
MLSRALNAFVGGCATANPRPIHQPLIMNQTWTLGLHFTSPGYVL